MSTEPSPVQSSRRMVEGHSQDTLGSVPKCEAPTGGQVGWEHLRNERRSIAVRISSFQEKPTAFRADQRIKPQLMLANRRHDGVRREKACAIVALIRR